MKILLLEHPRTISPERCNDIANTPLSSCLLTGYTAGMLESRGHQTKIVEGYLDRLDFGEIETTLETVKPGILGVHMVYQWQSDRPLFDFLERVKHLGLASYITVYGFYPTIACADILQACPAIDSVILGEPEITFAEVAAGFAGAEVAANFAGLERVQIPGLAVRDGGGGIRFQRRELVEDLDRLPSPVRTEAMYRIPEVNIQGSRGCYGSCTFCYINPFYGERSRWRGRSPENIAAEIEAIISRTGADRFYFTDPNFFGPGQMGQERARHLALLLKPLGIEFGLEGRVNDIHDETIGMLAEAGLRHILIGLESGRDESLRRMNKMTTVAQNEKALAVLRKHGIEPNIGFIMFEPDATLGDVRANFDFLKRNHLLHNLPVTANVLYHHQIVLKGTPSFKKLREAGWLDVEPGSPYEGKTPFANPEVAVLARLMRRVTNYLFWRMSGIWSGKVLEPEGAGGKYAGMNRMLVNLFEKALQTLERGEDLTDWDVDELARLAKLDIDRTLGEAGPL